MLLDTAGGTVIANNTLSKVQALNASPGMGNVDLLVDGSNLFPALGFGSPSIYSKIPSTSTTFAFQATATPGAIIAQATGPIPAATDATVLLLGFPGAQTAKIYPRQQPAPADEHGSGALHQCVAGCAAARRADQRRQDDLGPQVRRCVGLRPADDRHVHVKFVDPVTGTVSPALVGVVFNQGVYTVYAVGANSSMQAIYSVDR